MIRAEVHSDDYEHAVKFDATPWFMEATVEQIVDLAQHDFGGDYPSDHVALHFDDEQGYEPIAALFEYTRDQHHAVGFECHIHEQDVWRWLKENRPGILTAVSAVLGYTEEALLSRPGSEPHWDSDTTWKGEYLTPNLLRSTPRI